MKATMKGWRIVWPQAIGSALSVIGLRPAKGSSTKSSRGTVPIASSTR